jgi:N-glycosylase/DNA lyase
MTKVRTYTDIDRLLHERRLRGAQVAERLQEFASVPRGEYYFELVYCLLTPQSSAVNAGKAVAALRAEGLGIREIDPRPILASRDHYIRFHNTKATRILEAHAMLPEILETLDGSRPGESERRWLVERVKGLGWKEASHFLRNIGRRDLAILDRHILRNLQRHGAIRSIPTTLTPKRYLAIEARFRRFAAACGMAMDEIDLLLWSRETGEILK